MRIGVIAVGLGLSLAALDARADGANVWDRHFVLGVQTDPLPLPLSSILAVFEVAPVRWASIEVGGGVSILQRPAALGILHLQAPFRRWAPGVEGGFLIGPMSWAPGLETDGVAFGSTAIGAYFHDHSDMAVFGRLGGAVAFRVTDGKFQIRVHAGVMGLLNRNTVYCVSENGRNVSGCHFQGLPDALPYLGVTLGRAFNVF